VDSFSLYQRALSVALRMAGSEARLARHLQVPVGELEGWLQGKDPVPRWAFLAAVDIITNEGYVTQVPVEPARRSISSIHSRSSADSQDTLSAQAPLRNASA